MSSHRLKQLRWIKQAQIPQAMVSAEPDGCPSPTARERLIAALADRPQTVAQLAQAFGLSQPTVLDHVRRALRDGLIVEVSVAADEKRFAAERYYEPAVPVIRQPDRELLESACRAIADDVAAALVRHSGDLRAAFAMTTLAREGWSFEDLLPYLSDTTQRLALGDDAGMAAYGVPQHGLAWVEEVGEFAVVDNGDAASQEEREEESA